MKKLVKIPLLLTAFILFSAPSVVTGSEATAYKLEKALAKYILCYEAYASAKQSGDINVRSRLPKYIKAYRESYAQYLELLNKEGLYKPNAKRNNPAGAYNKNQRKKGGARRKWKPARDRKERENVKQIVREGKSVEEVMLIVQQSLPSTPNSESAALPGFEPRTVASSGDTTTTTDEYIDDDPDDDDADFDWNAANKATDEMLNGNGGVDEDGDGDRDGDGDGDGDGDRDGKKGKGKVSWDDPTPPTE